jgi:two-component system competent response regulator ComA
MIVDDHPLMAHATAELLGQFEGLSVVAVIRNGKDCVELASRYQPDLILLDYLLPDMTGLEVAQHIKKQLPDTHVVIFTGVDVTSLAARLLEIQVSGIISKGTSYDTLKHAIACILDGQVVIPRMSAQQIFPNTGPSVEGIELTEDEVAIMTMIVKGSTLEQIAERIHMSKRSVDNYQRKIYDKFNVKGRAQAIEAFVRTKYYME